MSRRQRIRALKKTAFVFFADINAARCFNCKAPFTDSVRPTKFAFVDVGERFLGGICDSCAETAGERDMAEKIIRLAVRDVHDLGMTRQ
jgi:hypothetical protein